MLIFNNMVNITPYRPFSSKTDFISLLDKDGEIKEISNVRFGYRIKIKPNGYIFKTGCLVVDAMEEVPFLNCVALDIGTGESGLLAINMAARGAKRVYGIDIDKQAISWAKINAKHNHLEKIVTFKSASLDQYKPKIKFDVISSNPPQMPSKENTSWHDDGGVDGKKYIKEVIDFSAHYLNHGGKLFFASFDFLGINKSYNVGKSIFDILKLAGFKAKIIEKQQKTIKPGSYSGLKLDWIKKQYPTYKFRKNKTHLDCYYVLVVEATKT